MRLGDMGVKGNVGRIAMNVLSPDALLMSMAGGWVTRGAVAAQGFRASKLAQAAAEAQRVQRAGKTTAVAGGIAFGAAENAAYESLRQSVNFEDDTAGVVEAGLMGALFTTPFALAGARQSRRVASAAKREHEVLGALKKVEDGAELSPAEMKTLKETHEIHTAIRDLEAGRIDEDAFNARLDDFHGPVEPIELWSRRHGERLRQQSQDIIDELFPGSKGRATGRAAPSEAQMRQMDEAVDLETKTNFPESVAAANAGNPKLEGQMASAFKVTLRERAQLRKAFDLEEMNTASDAAKKAERDAAFAKAEADRNRQLAADQDRMINAREMARAAGEEDPFVQAAKAAEASPTNPDPQGGDLVDQQLAARDLVRSLESRGIPAEGTPERSQYDAAKQQLDEIQAERADTFTAASAYVGRDVSWPDPKTGETLEGRAMRVSPTGKLVVETSMGEMKAVSHTSLDQHPGTAPSGFLPGSVGAAQVAKIASIANQRTAMSQARMDFFAILNRSEHEGVRELTFKLVKDAIQVDKQEAQGWTASEHKKQLQRTLGGNFHRRLDEALSEAIEAAKVPILERGAFKTQFMELATRETRGDYTVRARHRAIYPQIQKAASAMKETYARLLDEAHKANVKGAQGVAPNDLYVNRIWDHHGIRDAIAKHGEDKVVDLLARSINVPGLIGDRAKAKRFLDTVRRLEFSTGLQNIHLQGRDMGTLRAELAAHGLAQRDIDDLVDVLFDARATSGGDAGQAANLRFRFDFDETAAVNLPSGVLRLQDLFENDARVVMDRYINSMAGHIGLARVGIDSQATWAAQLKRIEDEALTRPDADGVQLNKELGYLRDIQAHITGRPMSTQDFSYTARAAAAMRGYTRSVMLGQLGLTAAFEMNRAVSLVGFRAMWQSMPALRDFISALRRGYIPEKGLAEDILNMTGFGNEMASSYARAHELENGFAGGTITRFEKGANTVSHVSDVISGNASFTSITRQMTAMGATRQAFDFAMGKKKLTAKLRERWVGQGLDDAEIDAVLSDLKAHAVHNNGTLESIRYEDWLRDEPETYGKFQLFLSRQVRDAIQDQDIGETMPFMHTTLGKVLSELKTFMLVAHAKNFLKQLEYRDATALQMWSIAMLAESLAYSMQAAVNYPDQLDEKLTPEAIAKGAFARASINGLVPLAVEAGHVLLTGGDSFFQEGATGNTDNRAPWKTPSYIVATRLFNAAPVLSGAITGAGSVNQQEFRELWRGLPFSRLYSLPALGNYFAETFPKSDPQADD
jgi:hypothetical protein